MTYAIIFALALIVIGQWQRNTRLREDLETMHKRLDAIHDMRSLAAKRGARTRRLRRDATALTTGAEGAE